MNKMTKFKKMTKITAIIFLFIFVIFAVLAMNAVFSGQVILPQAFHFGFVYVHFYGLIMALAVLAAFFLAKKRAGTFGLNDRQVEDVALWLVVGGFICARLYHVASDFGFYRHNPVLIFQVWRGGLSIFGALLGGALTLWLYKKNTNYPFGFLHFLDWLAPSVLIGQIIGRLGNLINYEAFGYPTNLPWKMYVPPQFRPEGLANSMYFHPLFLYEILGNAIILFLLIYVFKFKRQGELFFSYLLLYNVLRFCLEFLRSDSTFLGTLRLNSVSSCLLIFLSAGVFIYRKFYYDQDS